MHHSYHHDHHIESHFKAGDVVRDIVIGMSDGLTVPFALAAGLSGAVHSTHIIIAAGFAEITAGSISMGLGGYLAARSEAEHYYSERAREKEETITVPQEEKKEVEHILKTYGLNEAESKTIVESLSQRPKQWIDFMMRYELGLEEPGPWRAEKSAGTIAGSYIVGGLVPLFPYIIISEPAQALTLSITVTLAALLVFGFVKSRFTGANAWIGAIKTALIGGVAAAAAFGLAKLIA